LSREKSEINQAETESKNSKHIQALIKYKYDKKAAQLTCILLAINEKAPIGKLKIGAFIVQKAHYF
jgi:hypothetical protein